MHTIVLKCLEIYFIPFYFLFSVINYLFYTRLKSLNNFNRNVLSVISKAISFIDIIYVVFSEENKIFSERNTTIITK